MSQENNLPDGTERPEGEGAPQASKPSYTPASPAKRVLAWMGIVYMLILIALSTYGLATGSLIRGAAGIMVAPACFAMTALQVLRARELRQDGRSLAGAAVIGVLAAAVGIYSLADGVARVAAQLG